MEAGGTTPRGQMEIRPSGGLGKWLWALFEAVALCILVRVEFISFSIFKVFLCLVLVAGLCQAFLPMQTRRLFLGIFGSIEYIEITSPALELRIRERFKSEFAQFSSLGFSVEFFYGQTFPYLRLLLIYPAIVIGMMLWKREVLAVIDGTKLLNGHVAFASANRNSYAHPLGLGVLFHTVFQDGKLLISANYGESSSGRNYLRYSYKHASISQTWAAHQQSIRTQELNGNPVDMQISFTEFIDITR